MTLTLSRSGNLLPSLTTDLFDDDFFSFPNIDLNGNLLSSRLRKNLPAVNVIENDNSYTLELATPGLRKEDLKVNVDNGVLTISSEKEKETEEKDENYTRKEFSYRAFSRSFNLPENTIAEKITANYDNGILSLTIPKQEVTVSKPKKEIKVS